MSIEEQKKRRRRRSQAMRYGDESSAADAALSICVHYFALQYWREKIVQCRLQEQKKRGMQYLFYA